MQKANQSARNHNRASRSENIPGVPSQLEDLFGDEFFEIKAAAKKRLFGDGHLFDSSGHALKDGLSKERARAILLICLRIASSCGLKLVFSVDEQKLIKSKFDVAA